MATSQHRYFPMVRAKVLEIENSRIKFDNTDVALNLDHGRKTVHAIFEEADICLNKKLDGEKEQWLQERPEATNQVDEEHREEGSISWLTLKKYILSMGVCLAILFVIFNTAMQAARSFIDFWLKWESKANQNQCIKGLESLGFLGGFVKTFGLLLGIQVLVAFIRCFLYASYNLLSARNIFKKLIKRIIYSKISFFDFNNAGSILNRATADTFEIDDKLPWYIHVFFECFARVLLYPIVVAVEFPILSIVLVFFIWALYHIQKKYRSIMREIKRLNTVNLSKIINHYSETLSGVETIRSFGKDHMVLQELLIHIHNQQKSFLINRVVTIWTRAKVYSITFLILLSIAILILVAIFTHYRLDHLSISMGFTFVLLLVNQLDLLIEYLSEAEQRFISFERIRVYFDNQKEDLGELRIPEFMQNNNDKKGESEYSVIFENVFFSYPAKAEVAQSGLKAKYSSFLKDLCFQIKKGQKVAFLGRTGSGKSTILNLIYGLYEFEDGRIIIDGLDSKTVPLSVLRRKMAVIPQFGFLFKGSLRENIDPFRRLSNEELSKGLANIGLRLRKTGHSQPIEVDSLQDLDFSVSAGGSNLSNGERQLINFLRIYFLNNDIICLDEATSNMDPTIDKEIHKKLFDISEGKTLIVVTHKLEFIEEYDKVFVMENGRIIESGSPKSLKKNPGSFLNKASLF